MNPFNSFQFFRRAYSAAQFNFVAFQVATVNNAINTVANVSPICNLIQNPHRPPFSSRCAEAPLAGRQLQTARRRGGISDWPGSWEDALRVPYFDDSALFYNIFSMSRILGPSCIPPGSKRFFLIEKIARWKPTLHGNT